MFNLPALLTCGFLFTLPYFCWLLIDHENAFWRRLFGWHFCLPFSAVFNSELILKADSNVVGPTKGVVELQFPLLSRSMGLPPNSSPLHILISLINRAAVTCLGGAMCKRFGP